MNLNDTFAAVQAARPAIWHYYPTIGSTKY